MNYQEFLESKAITHIQTGIENPPPLNPKLFPFQRDVVSEGFVALKMRRRFVGVELKESYWKRARLNLLAAEQSKEQEFLFKEAV